MDEIILISNRNRDGAKLWLQQIGNSNQYVLKTNKDYVLEYARVIFDDVPDDAEIFDFNWNGRKAICRAYDPSGGPYITVGEKINEKYSIGRIYVDYNNDKQLKFSIIKN